MDGQCTTATPSVAFAAEKTKEQASKETEAKCEDCERAPDSDKTSVDRTNGKTRDAKPQNDPVAATALSHSTLDNEKSSDNNGDCKPSEDKVVAVTTKDCEDKVVAASNAEHDDKVVAATNKDCDDKVIAATNNKDCEDKVVAATNKECEGKVVAATKKDCESVKIPIIKEQNVSPDADKPARRCEAENTKRELKTATVASNDRKTTNEAEPRDVEASRCKIAMPTDDNQTKEEIIEDNEDAETSGEDFTLVDSMDASMETKNVSPDDDVDAKVVIVEKMMDRMTNETLKKKDDGNTLESTTETIEYSVIEYADNDHQSTAISQTAAYEIIVETKDENDDTTIPTNKTSINDDGQSQNDLTPKSTGNIVIRESIDDEEIENSIVDKTNNSKSFDDGNSNELDESESRKSFKVTPSSAIVASTVVSALPEKPETSMSSSVPQRSVIQDIFDDWRDENPEDEGQGHQMSKSDDSVEMNLKILLDDDKPHETDYHDETMKNIVVQQSSIVNNDVIRNPNVSGMKTSIVRVQSESSNREDIAKLNENNIDKMAACENNSDKMASNDDPLIRETEKIAETTTNKDRTNRQKPLAPRPGVKVPGFILSSPIVTKNAVSKVLKERMREQQKEFDATVKPDLFFVKKITQRLSNKLAAAAAVTAGQLSGQVTTIGQTTIKPDVKISQRTTSTSEVKKSPNVDKELLAILEGDVDPDWSNLKSANFIDGKKQTTTTTTTTASTIETNNPTKLDPTIERELALKQLLELPNAVPKKSSAKKIPVKTPKKKDGKLSKNLEPNRETEKIVINDDVESRMETTMENKTKECDNSSTTNASSMIVKTDETRSGRKRKLTEKAREHVQMSTKKFKTTKLRSPNNKRLTTNLANDSSMTEVTAHAPQLVIVKSPKITTPTIEKNSQIDMETEKSSTKPSNDTTNVDSKNFDDSQPTKLSETIVQTNATKKKSTINPNAKRKLAVERNIIRPKITTNENTALNVRTKFPKTMTKRASNKKSMTTKGQQKKLRKRANTTTEKTKKKSSNEIDKLLQDEGVVNLLYDVEQPRKKRLIPITQSQTKVMDLQKIRRELKIRTKLVRNAVLRLRTSNMSANKVSPRSKRSVSYNSDASLTEKKFVNDERANNSEMASEDFIYPAKIRNAADASIIIRRHSSSSFSSASASLRASVDAPAERLSIDTSKNDDSVSHALRSNKRLHSVDTDDEKSAKTSMKKKKGSSTIVETKKNRKKALNVVLTPLKIFDKDETPPTTTGENDKTSIDDRNDDFDVVATPRTTKKNVKTMKIDDVEFGKSAGAKNSRRSNGSATGKLVGKCKKSIKGKICFVKGNESATKSETTVRDDELSACLAEVVTALANDNVGSSRGKFNVPVNRCKTKGIAGSVKISETDGNKSKPESRVQFSNKEINVQRHGNLVQLLLTPSKTTKMRNGITLQVMQEIRENLSILKKDEECRVVLLTSTGSSFCEGLELTTILHEDKEERRIRAQELANGVKEFIKSLATFNKPIVAGVQGSAIGLGVTMLPWFDLVIASDKATFSTPYGKLGQIAEGAAIFTLSHILGSAVTSELLLGGRTLTASEALRAGLVSRVLWPDRFQAELLPSLRSMSEQSSQSMEATKALLRHSLRKKLDAALESESYLLVQHWCSTECQKAITAYVDEHIH